MKTLRAIFWCLATVLYIEGSLEAVNVTYHSRRAHRHEKSRLRRQHSAEPSVYILESEDGTGPEDERGDWGPWSPPSPCSRTCGGGVSYQTRECSAYSSCTGGKKRYFSCNTQECSGGGDFRAEQCAAYNSIQYDGYYYQWVPYTKADNKCALNCMPRGERYYYRHQDKVHDGTKCSEDSLDICVNGKCMPVGCDLLLGSTAREDQCRVCGGDGSTCTTKSGLLEDNAQLPGYIDLLLIPIGATNIKIKERRASNNYLAIRNTTGHFYLNGNWQIDFSRSLKFAGTIFYYNRKPYPFSGPESIHALGPTTEALYVSLLYQETNPGFEYVYSVPKGSVKETPREAYKWRFGEFSSCSVTCGGGYQSRKVWCSHGSEEVSFELCDPASEPAKTQICASQACAAAWHTTEWSPCDAPCGELGTQTREVSCQQVVGTGQPVLVTESRCPGEKPPNTQPCKETGPCPTWHVGPWKPCDRLCGEGKQTRELHCYRKIEGRIELLSSSSCAEKKPESEKSCHLRPCEGLDWIASDWSGCSDKCGQAVETRTASCANEKGEIFNESMCHDYRKPELVRNCTYKPCASQWFASQWSECSVKCGAGVQTRDVFCASFEGVTLTKVDDSKCDAKQKYESTKECKAEGECKGEWFASPFSECSKKCGGGVMERKVICLKQNKTVDIKECDASKFLLTTEECNKEPCGEDEILPVEPTQIITEDDSEECDYDEYDEYDETTDKEDLIPTGNNTLSTVGVLKLTDEIEEGSGDFMDDFIFSSKTSVSEGSSEKASSSFSFPTESYESTTSGSSSTPDTLKDEAVTDTATATETSLGSSTDSSFSMDVTSLSSLASSVVSFFTESSSEMSSVSSSGSSTDMTDSSSASSVSTDVSLTSTDSSSVSSVFSSTDLSESSESTTDSTFPETSSSSLMTENYSVSTSESATVASVSSSVSSSETSPSSISHSSETSESTVSATEVSGEFTTESLSSSTESGLLTTGGESTTWSGVSEFTSMGTSDLTELIFGVSTPGPESEVTKARRKCKKRSGKRKCASSKFGCCPDNKTEAKGPFAKGCPMPKTCEESKFGCCPDKVSPAKGPNNRGCPASMCEQTLFGCCPDGSTPSMGNDYEGCPQATTLPPDCTTTKYGCCPDGILSATGPKNAGCFESCNETTHGCCPDGETAALGPNFKGCDIIVAETCSNTTHGCCPDGITIAEGPDEEGCQNCTESKYGCCPDGIIAARGANMFGCPPTCTLSTFGCCEDNVTIAHGPNFEGCCLNSPYGCCKDDITPAQGPNYYGCECERLTFGCCPDGRTPARGPNKEDCGCAYTEHGCCPDRITAASGPSYDGCSCHTFQFGCCPDGVTVVKGPNLQGCGCRNSEYGCCPDEVTTRPGLGENCTCDASKYGCCPDGITEAGGTNFEGCENVPVTGEVCALPRDNGHCRNFKIFYYFDTTYGGCARLWYGGCGGNGNRFASLEECKAACVHPKGKDACLLPKSAGSCKHDISKWFYDKQYKRCRQFSYTGCLGNSNKFATSEECEQVCGTQDHLDPCDQTLEPGPCKGSYERWYYNKDSEACLPFTYGGCKGTKNNFPTEAACKAKCSRPDKVKEVCSVPKAVGNCKEKLPKWYFDSTERRCMPFYYTNCNGNGNNFDSREGCEESCPLQIAKDVCFLPSDVGDCYNYTQRYYFDILEGRCKLFYYGGCGGNGNNFVSESQCQRRCDRTAPEEPKEPQPQPQPQFTESMCYLEPQRGRCSENIPKWHYDYNDGSCKQFEYSGCDGNGNSFDSEEECQQSCSSLQDPCSLPKVAGQCDRWALYWYFDRDAGACRQFHYGGCSGNKNRFGSESDCRRTCLKQVAPPIDTRVEPAPDREPQPQPQPQSYTNICYLEQDPGPCSDKIEAWSYDRSSGGCVSFTYGGCNGNANRFSSEEQCERQCGEFKGQDACSPSFEVGTCDQSIQKYYFDSLTATCFPFFYSGCGGNPNRFSTAQECQDICEKHIEPPLAKGVDTEESNKAVCNQPMESGACDEHINRWFYDDKRRSCESFIYSGCAGNLNNFDSAEDCIDFCSVVPSDPNEINVGQKPEKTDCASIEAECLTLSCSYGIERWVDDNECSACRCHDPCATSPPPCRSLSTCEVTLVPNPETGLSEYRARCRDDVPTPPKPGTCPDLGPDFKKCESDCHEDSDCQREEKCCYNGCGYSCIMPQTTDDSSGRQQPPDNYNIEGSPPFISDETQENQEAHEGNLAALHCLAQGAPVPTITWERNGEQLDPATSSKYRITDNGTLEIIGLSKEDSGIYTCHATNGIDPPAKKDFQLTVRDGTPMPVSVVNNRKDSNVVVSLGNPAVLRCYAIGYPLPTVTWWRGDRMLPMSSEDLEQRRDNTLLIRAVKISSLGYYTCQLYNGQGKAASYTLTLKVFGPVNSIDPNDVTYNQFLEPAAPPSPPVDKPQPPPYVPPPPPPRPETVPSEPESPDGLVFPQVTSAAQELTEGSSLKMTCRVEGDLAQYPVYSWQKDDQPLYVNDRISITNNELFISKVIESDSGSYKCKIEQPSGSFESPVRVISVQKVTLPPNCTDSRYFANCALIVEANYCQHKYYAKFCCKSCTESGKLPPSYHQTFSERRKRSIMSSAKLLPSRMTPINAPEDTRKIILKRPGRLMG